MPGTSDAAYKAWETRRRNGWVHPNARDIVEDARATPKKTAAPTLTRGQKATATKNAKRRAAVLTGRAKKAVATRRKKARG